MCSIIWSETLQKAVRHTIIKPDDIIHEIIQNLKSEAICV